MIHRVSLDVTHRCNLSCKLCAIHAPYFKEKWHPTLEHLKESIDRIFALVPCEDPNTPILNRLVLAGGEPFLRNDLPQILEHCSIYEKKIKERIEIITNASILPSQQLLKISKKLGKKMYYIVDNYGESLSTKYYDIGRILSENGIPHELRDYHDNPHCGGWVDFGDFSHKRDYKEAKKLFAKCSFPQKLNLCIKVFNGRVDPCSQSLHAMRLGLFDEPNEYFSLFDDSISLENKWEKIEKWYKADYFTACEYCDGMCDDSVRFLPAEQLTKEELAEIDRGVDDSCLSISIS